MAQPTNPINIPDLGVSRELASLGIFLTQALQNPDWGEIKVKLPLRDEPLSLNRQQCQEILKQKILPDVFKKDSDFYSQVEDLKNPENLDLLGNYLVEQEIPGQNDPRIQQVREGYKLFLQNQAAGAEADPQTPAQILPASEARKTAKAVSQIQIQLSDKIGQAIEDNLQQFPASYRQRVKQNLTDQLTHEALSELSSPKGQLTDKQGNLSPRFANRVSHLFKKTPALRAAIINSQYFDKSLQEKLAGTDQEAVQEAYNTFRNFQITAGPKYHQLANKLSPYLTEAEINKVINHLEGVPPGSNPLAIRQNLAAALSPFEKKLSKTGVNTTRLTNNLSTSFQYFLNNPSSRAGHFHHYPPGLRKLAKQMGIKNFQNPKEFRRLQALYIYTNGYSSEKLKQLKAEGKFLTTNKHGKIEIDDNLVGGVENFENKQGKGFFRRWSAENKSHRQYKKTAKRLLKIEKKQKLLAKMQTNRLGLAGGFSHRQAWGNKVENFKDNGKFGWALAPGRRLHRKLSVWLEKKGLEGASKAVGEKGLRGLAKYLAVKGLTKIGLKVVVSAVTVVGTIIIGALTAVKAFYNIVKNPEAIKKILQTMVFGAGAAIYFLYKLITTYPLTFIGIMFGSPLGPMGMLAGGFMGFVGDKIVGGLKGAVSHLANTSTTALETAVSLPANAAAAPLGFATVAVPVIGPIIITFIAAWIAISTFFSAFSLSSVATVEKGMPMSTFTQLEEVKDFPYEESADDLLASEIAQIAEDCVSGIVNKDTWEQFKECLENSLIDGKVKERVIQELNHSVNELPDNENLQCVGFVLAAFPDKNLPHQNAVDFLYNYGDLQKNTIPQKGDIAVWGPYPDKCSASPGDASDYCEANSSCCGHVGIVNKVEGNNVYVTSAWGESGIINTVKFSSTSDEKPWTYLR